MESKVIESTVSYEPGLRYQLFIPRQFNPDAFGQRVAVPQATFDRLNERLTGQFPGLTGSVVQPPIGLGMWLDEDDIPFPDEVYLYDLVDETAKRQTNDDFFKALPQELLQPPENALLGLGQKSVMLIVTDVYVMYAKRLN